MEIELTSEEFNPWRWRSVGDPYVRDIRGDFRRRAANDFGGGTHLIPVRSEEASVDIESSA